MGQTSSRLLTKNFLYSFFSVAFYWISCLHCFKFQCFYGRQTQRLCVFSQLLCNSKFLRISCRMIFLNSTHRSFKKKNWYCRTSPQYFNPAMTHSEHRLGLLDSVWSKAGKTYSLFRWANPPLCDADTFLANSLKA